jgi:hypothetical protein
LISDVFAFNGPDAMTDARRAQEVDDFAQAVQFSGPFEDPTGKGRGDDPARPFPDFQWRFAFDPPR